MWKFTMHCTKCQHPFTYEIYKFRSYFTCTNCGKKLAVSMRHSIMLAQIACFLLVGQYATTQLESMLGEHAIIPLFIVLFILLTLGILVFNVVLIKLFGVKAVFVIHDNDLHTLAQKNDNKKT